ncbi:MAG: hypothetical protein ABIC68_01205 [Candidatus Omnitrophota bacterium]
MKINRLFCVGMVGLFCFFSYLQLCSAELYVSKKGLFKIDVPQDWEWTDQLDSVIISNVEQDSAIIIKMQSQSSAIASQEQIEEVLGKGIENIIEKVKLQKGIVVSEKSKSLDGSKAKQVNFLLTSDGGKAHASFVAVFASGYLFTIYMEGPDEGARAKMEKIINRIKFLGR